MKRGFTFIDPSATLGVTDHTYDCHLDRSELVSVVERSQNESNVHDLTRQTVRYRSAVCHPPHFGEGKKKSCGRT